MGKMHHGERINPPREKLPEEEARIAEHSEEGTRGNIEAVPEDTFSTIDVADLTRKLSELDFTNDSEENVAQLRDFINFDLNPSGTLGFLDILLALRTVATQAFDRKHNLYQIRDAAGFEVCHSGTIRSMQTEAWHRDRNVVLKILFENLGHPQIALKADAIAREMLASLSNPHRWARAGQKLIPLGEAVPKSYGYGMPLDDKGYFERWGSYLIVGNNLLGIGIIHPERRSFPRWEVTIADGKIMSRSNHRPNPLGCIIHVDFGAKPAGFLASGIIRECRKVLLQKKKNNAYWGGEQLGFEVNDGAFALL